MKKVEVHQSCNYMRIMIIICHDHYFNERIFKKKLYMLQRLVQYKSLDLLDYGKTCLNG